MVSLDGTSEVSAGLAPCSELSGDTLHSRLLLTDRPGRLAVLEVRPPECSWRAEPAHMAGNMLPARAGESSLGPPQLAVTVSHLLQPGLWLLSGLHSDHLGGL